MPAEPWASLARRGLRGVKLAISDAHEGLKAAVAKVLHATWQRCRVHTMRNLLAHAGRQGRGVAAAFIATALPRTMRRRLRLNGARWPISSGRNCRSSPQ
jgi:putative transposase